MSSGAKPRVFALILIVLGASPSVAQRDEHAARVRAGAEALRQGRVYDALEILDEVATQGSPSSELHLLLGQASLAAGLWRKSKAHFEAVIAADPGNGLAAFMLGFSLYQAARYVEAVAALERARSLAPLNPNPSVYRGLALLKLGHPDDARRELERALGLAQPGPVGLLGMAELELATGNTGVAEERARQALRLDPNQVEGKILLGRILLESGRVGEAVQTFTELRAALPRRSDLLYLLSQALLRSGDQEQGRRVIESFREQKAMEERIRLLDATVSVDSDAVDPRIELVGLLIENEQWGAARLHLTALRKVAGQRPKVRELEARLARRGSRGS